MRRGRSFGAIVTTPAGERAFIVYKRIKDVFRNGATSVSNAIRAEDAYWSVDEGFLMEARGKGIRIVGVFVRETDELYLTALSSFFGPKQARLTHPWVRPGERYLSLSHFRTRYSIPSA